MHAPQRLTRWLGNSFDHAIQPCSLSDRIGHPLNQHGFGWRRQPALERGEFNRDDPGTARFAAVMHLSGVVLLRIDPERASYEIVSCQALKIAAVLADLCRKRVKC